MGAAKLLQPSGGAAEAAAIVSAARLRAESAIQRDSGYSQGYSPSPLRHSTAEAGTPYSDGGYSDGAVSARMGATQLPSSSPSRGFVLAGFERRR